MPMQNHLDWCTTQAFTRNLLPDTVSSARLMETCICFFFHARFQDYREASALAPGYTTFLVCMPVFLFRPTSRSVSLPEHQLVLPDVFERDCGHDL